MITQLCASFFQEWGILIILVVFLIFMLVFSASKRKKDAKMAEDFANNLKVGDKVKTYSGIYGKIISITDTPNGKVATIETGEGKNVSYMSVDVYAIYNIEAPVNEKKVESTSAGTKAEENVVDNASVVDSTSEQVADDASSADATLESADANEIADASVATEAKSKKGASKGGANKNKKSSKQDSAPKSDFEKLKEQE